jgi:putative AlgH/UPF0301 family transcriptional regulator
MDSRVGKLLIAHPNLPKDNWFYKTVIYIYSDHPNAGTLGITLNVPTTLTVNSLSYSKGILYPNEVDRCYKGGPVSKEAVIMLHTDEWCSRNTIPAGNGYRLSSDSQMFERLALGDYPAYWRMFMGLSAWAPGQLDLELTGQFPYKAESSWLLADATDYNMFNVDQTEQWEAAVELSSQQMINQFF